MPDIEELKSMPVEQLISELRRREGKKKAGEDPALAPEDDLNGFNDFDDETIVGVIREVQPTIYGVDNRVDIYQLPPGANLDDADSVCAIFRGNLITDNGNGTSTVSTQPFGQIPVEIGTFYRPCETEPFYNQPCAGAAIQCTGFLVYPDVIATAGHCVRDESYLNYYRFVFGFRMLDAVTVRDVIDNSEIYRGVSIIGRHFSDDNDWCLVRLNRPVNNHRVARLRKSGRVSLGQALHVIGHPLGLPLKFADGAMVRDNSEENFFIANLDVYAGNSGSPVFNSDTHEVEGVLSAGDIDFVLQGNCYVSLVCPDTGCGGDWCMRTTLFSDLIDKEPKLVLEAFGYEAGGWRVDKHPRLLADVTGKGRADIVAFGNNGVYVALSNGDGTFDSPQFAVPNFGYSAGGWRVDKHPRLLANLTRSNKGCDIVGFGDAGVWVSLGHDDATFDAPQLVVNNFGYSAGNWRTTKHPRLVADLSGDGFADIVGFGAAGVWVSAGYGDGTFAAPQLVTPHFGTNASAGGWLVSKHPRFVADITGNGLNDIIGFGNSGVWVARNLGGYVFDTPQQVVQNFGYAAGSWRVDKHPRFIADLTGMGRADIVGFGDKGVWVALSKGDGTFGEPQLVLEDFGYEPGGWRVDKHPRFLADTTGDECADIIGFGDDGVWLSTNRGDGTFNSPRLIIENFGYTAGDWRTQRHPRFLADITGDKCADIIGFGIAGVWVSKGPLL